MASAAAVPTITLNDGAKIPQLGFGTLNVPPGRERTDERMTRTAEVVGQALEVGYRHIDTAQSYGNERGVGDAIASSGIPRDELYVTSKLANGNHLPDDVHRTFEETLERLGLDQLDLFLIHWPMPMLYDGDFVSTWRAMNDLVADGRLRSAGVSNFLPEYIDRIVEETGIAPAVNQFQIHPHFANDASRAATAAHGTAIEAWSPLGQGGPLDEDVIGRIAAAHGKTPAQVVLRWHVDHGHIVIPKTMHRERMAENIALFDFELGTEEIAAIDALDRGVDGRIGDDPSEMALIL